MQRGRFFIFSFLFWIFFSIFTVSSPDFVSNSARNQIISGIITFVPLTYYSFSQIDIISLVVDNRSSFKLPGSSSQNSTDRTKVWKKSKNVFIRFGTCLQKLISYDL